MRSLIVGHGPLPRGDQRSIASEPEAQDHGCDDNHRREPEDRTPAESRHTRTGNDATCRRRCSRSTRLAARSTSARRRDRATSASAGSDSFARHFWTRRSRAGGAIGWSVEIGGGWKVENRGDQACLTRPLEGPLAGGHLVHDSAERKEVRARVDTPPLQLLGRHVLKGPDDHPLARQAVGTTATRSIRRERRRLARTVAASPDQSRATSRPNRSA